MFDEADFIGPLGMETNRSGEGECTADMREPLGGGLFTTPSSIGLVEKFIVEWVVAPEYKKFPLFEIVNWP